MYGMYLNEGKLAEINAYFESAQVIQQGVGVKTNLGGE